MGGRSGCAGNIQILGERIFGIEVSDTRVTEGKRSSGYGGESDPSFAPEEFGVGPTTACRGEALVSNVG